MPGEQLTCVVQLAFEKYGGSSLQRSSICNVFDDINICKCINYTKRELKLKMAENAKFSQLKEFILTKRNKEITKREIRDTIEKGCWEICRNFYSKCPFRLSEVYKLWRIFNRVADEETYPLVMKKPYADWIMEKFVSIADLPKKKTNSDRDLTFQDFLSSLQHSFSIDSIVSATKEVHDWLVKESIRAGWVYVKIKRRGNWSFWARHWINIAPGKVQFSKRKSEFSTVKSKSVFYLSENTLIQKDGSKRINRMHAIRISNVPVFECLIAVGNRNGMELWLDSLEKSMKHYFEDTTPIQIIFSEHTDTLAAPCLFKREESFMQYQIEKEKNKNSKREESSRLPEIENENSLNSVSTEKEKIKAVFLDYDKDGNGFLEKKEFEVALKEFGLKLSEAQSSNIFNTIDADGNGKIMFNEFYDYFLENILRNEKSVFCDAFTEADKEGRGVINFKAFSEIVRARHDSTSLDQVLACFDKLCDGGSEELLMSKDFMQSLAILDEFGLFPNSMGIFETQLKSRFDTCNSNELRDKIQKRWDKFASFRRPGENGKIAMSGGTDIVDDLVPGEYSLQDLAKFHDLPTILPKRTILKGVFWKSSNIPNTSGYLVFPSEFSGHLEVETATNDFLAYYGCKFANNRSEKVYLPYRHAIQDFTYENDYLTNYVEKQNKGSGLERHAFCHLDCPLDDDSGLFIIGKLIEDELHITAFRIPTRHTLYVPENCIHSNDYLRGTWRTMLSDESNVDHVHLKRRCKGKGEGLESFTFQFAS